MFGDCEVYLKCEVHSCSHQSRTVRSTELWFILQLMEWQKLRPQSLMWSKDPANTSRWEGRSPKQRWRLCIRKLGVAWLQDRRERSACGAHRWEREGVREGGGRKRTFRFCCFPYFVLVLSFLCQIWLPLPVGSLIVLTSPTQPTAHMMGQISAVSY